MVVLKKEDRSYDSLFKKINSEKWKSPYLCGVSGCFGL